MFFIKSICYTNTKHISYESKVTIHHLLSNFISEVYALDTNSYVKQEAAEKRVDNLLQKGGKVNMSKRKNAQRSRKYSVRNRTVKATKKYKDTIFRMLFENKENLLSLYNAMNRKNYTDADALQVVTLENSIYMGMKNDLAFILDMNLYLYEHQSTYNPNMPLRDLFYISNEYQKLVVQKSLYSSVLQKIPAPKFVVFYNGTKEIEDVSEFRLSSAYECQTDDPDLELRVTVLNVNEGHNQELMEHCQTLKEYAQYVAKVRKYTSLGELSLEEAVECAVEECIKEGILAEFLIQNRAEVISMSIFEYNKDEEEKKLRKAEFEAGREAGIEEGRIAGIEEGRIAGIEEGREEGRIELLKQLIQRKLSKGKSIDEIAEELEESVTVIQNIIGECEIK